MNSNDPNERASDAGQFGPFASSNPYSPDSPGLDDFYNQYNPNDPMRPQFPRARRSPTLRYIIGVVIFVVGAEALTYLIALANLKLKLHLDQPILGPQLNWLNWFFIINVLVIVALWIILKRLGFFQSVQPRLWRTNSRWREW